MAPTPTNIRVLSDEQSVEIHWPDGTVHQLPFKFLRGQCPCAGCVDEMTGVRTLDIDTIPDSIKPGNVGFTGHYALKITWSDGHDTGMYTWEYLQKLGNQQQATQ